MNREKQIEEMARTLCGEKEKTCTKCDSFDLCEFWIEASTLYNAGYIKQSEAKWGFKGTAYGCSLCGYGVIAPIYNFCPNCGAKMKEDEHVVTEQAYKNDHARGKSEVAREIFAEIEKNECHDISGKTTMYMLLVEELAELKKKYTEGET